MKNRPRILLVEDDRAITSGMEKVMEAEGYDVTVLARGDEGLDCALAEAFDVVISDLKLPGTDGLTLVRELHQAKPKLPIVLMTAHGTTDIAIEATRWGAFDYVPKPFEMDEMLDITARAIECSRLMSDPVEMGPAESGRTALVGRSRTMQAIYKEIGRVAATKVTVLIRGDTGTGKELVARAIYQHSNRAEAPFLAVNCSAIPEHLLESELFGHERGAFTGADRRHIGRFEQANGGTLFLDEIGDMNGNLQTKLLRVLEENTVQRVGGRESVPVDVRVIAATHRDLESAIQEKAFREDLYYRLSVVTIHLPPLDQRAEDIPDLIGHFLRKHGPEVGVEALSIQPEAVEFLQRQHWPGNVRELENVIRQTLLLARSYTISADHVREVLRKSRKPLTSSEQNHTAYVSDLLTRAEQGEVQNALAQMMTDLEPELYAQAIRRAQGNQAKAARWLGISRLRLREKLRQLGLHPSQDQAPDDTASPEAPN
ncbi:MAG: sigma-54-dependent Fis family transcriptional regulator [Verrucomicrobia bacterium]|jgi:nitrogen regulation protein NR(I)|nr:sigma-54-dependent Fis family transcriptional regulator [Verrucomicrobiota bacterium]MDI9382216.1 sigma-54 dependent transcriptional regulator [Verrucomicrobiota bacterium]NMD22153.1 sigma-54-dependent Fis family transcriptional regulator [Verrucomicrobiota bacterium]HOA62570.1 sigma-54 dependent transcriptional regulator [Verrucomicrobiota bacterium]HOF47655.1 sigma-54 dependent transcriptional regulator [Verrucomicrobiota bacterium]